MNENDINIYKNDGHSWENEWDITKWDFVYIVQMVSLKKLRLGVIN